MRTAILRYHPQPHARDPLLPVGGARNRRCTTWSCPSSPCRTSFERWRGKAGEGAGVEEAEGGEEGGGDGRLPESGSVAATVGAGGAWALSSRHRGITPWGAGGSARRGPGVPRSHPPASPDPVDSACRHPPSRHPHRRPHRRAGGLWHMIVQDRRYDVKGPECSVLDTWEP
jgi:hypothetical protein